MPHGMKEALIKRIILEKQCNECFELVPTSVRAIDNALQYRTNTYEAQIIRDLAVKEFSGQRVVITKDYDQN